MPLERAALFLALLSVPGVGPRTVWRAYRHEEGDLDAVATAVLAGRPGAAATYREALPRCRRAVEAAAAAGLRVLALGGAGYPLVLQADAIGPPPVLFVRGRLPQQVLAPHVSELEAVAVVGTRRASAQGLEEGRVLGRALAAAGAVVVSGLALGVDAAAHRGALEAQRRDPAAAPTVAVLGGAHDRLHPRAHAGLAAAIVEAGGAVVSEHPPGTDPRPHLFVARNRVVAGLARAVVVVEAGLTSGALSTADVAVKAGREVLTVPARPGDARRAGNLDLLRDRARVLGDLADLARAVGPASRVGLALSATAGPVGRRRGRRAGASRTLPDAGAAPLFTSYVGEGPAGSDSQGSVAGPTAAPSGSSAAYGRSQALPLDAACEAVLTALVELREASFDALLASLTRGGVHQRPTPAELAGCLVRLETRGRVLRGLDGRFRPAPEMGTG